MFVLESVTRSLLILGSAPASAGNPFGVGLVGSVGAGHWHGVGDRFVCCDGSSAGSVA